MKNKKNDKIKKQVMLAGMAPDKLIGVFFCVSCMIVFCVYCFIVVKNKHKNTSNN